MRKFSIGVFLDILTENKKEWIENLDFINSLEGVEHIEIFLEYIPSTNAEINFFKDVAKKYKIIVHAPCLDLNLLSPNGEIVNATISKLQKAYSFSTETHARVFTMHAGLMPKFWKEEKVLQELKKGMRGLRKLKTLPVCIENMPERWSIQIPYPCTPTHYKNIARFSFLTMDIGHFLKSKTNPIPILKRFSDKIQDIHLHDVYQGSDHSEIGGGILDLRAFIDVLEEIKYDKFVTIEVVGRKEIRESWKILQKNLV